MKNTIKTILFSVVGLTALNLSAQEPAKKATTGLDTLSNKPKMVEPSEFRKVLHNFEMKDVPKPKAMPIPTNTKPIPPPPGKPNQPNKK